MPTKRLFPWLVIVCMSLMVCVTGSAFAASTGSVKGTVHKNSASGSDLSGVKVTCDGKSDTTDSKGKFEIKKIPTGDQTLSFSKSGYQSFQISVKIVKNKTANVGDRWLTGTTAPVSAAPAPLSGTIGSVSGKIHNNAASGAPLSGVSVTCGGKSDTTDSNGKFEIKNISAGNQALAFLKSGYQPFQTSVKIVADKKANIGDRWLTEIATSQVQGKSQPNLSNSAYKSPLNKLATRFGGQCTWFAWGRAYEVTGRQMPTGDAYKWWYNPPKDLLTNKNVPKNNSIVVWDKCDANLKGHVAFVENVYDNGDIEINEANTGKYFKKTDFGGGYTGSIQRIKQSELNNRAGMGKLLGYIYLN